MALRDYRLENLPGSAQTLIFVVLATGLVAVFHVFYLRGPLEERENLQKEVAQLEAAVAQGRAIESQLSRFKSELGRLEERLEILRGILPAQKETAIVLRLIQQMAAVSNLRIVKFNPQPIVPRAFYSDWPIIMEVQGNYEALALFFEKISQLTRIINVDNMNIKGIDGSSDAFRTLSAICTVTIFVLREDPRSTRPDLP